MKILIVEDEKSLARLLRTILENAGYQVLGPVSTVTDAQYVINDVVPDIALIDIYLADGSEGTALAQKLAEKDDVAVLFTTADTERAQAYSPYALGLIQKPYPLSSIIPALKVVESIKRGEKIEGIPPALRLFRFLHEIEQRGIAQA